MVDFAFFVARWTLSRTRADDGLSVFAAIVGLGFVVAELVLNDAGFGSIGWLAATLLKQANGCASVHASMLTCGGNRRLQPTRVAAKVPMRSVLMQFPHQRGRVPLAVLAMIKKCIDSPSVAQKY